MKIPHTILEALDLAAENGISGRETVREAIEADTAYARAVLGAHAGKLLAAHRRAHLAVVDPLQADLFPGLPLVLYVRPGEAVSPMECTRYGLNMARNMLYARTSNQVQGATEAARRERDAIDGLCDLVLPVMAADPRMTVAQALDRIQWRGKGAACSLNHVPTERELSDVPA